MDRARMQKTKHLRPKRIDLSRLAYLKDKIPPGHPPFDLEIFRKQQYDSSLRN